MGVPDSCELRKKTKLKQIWRRKDLELIPSALNKTADHELSYNQDIYVLNLNSNDHDGFWSD